MATTKQDMIFFGFIFNAQGERLPAASAGGRSLDRMVGASSFPLQIVFKSLIAWTSAVTTSTTAMTVPAMIQGRSCVRILNQLSSSLDLQWAGEAFDARCRPFIAHRINAKQMDSHF